MIWHIYKGKFSDMNVERILRKLSNTQLNPVKSAE